MIPAFIWKDSSVPIVSRFLIVGKCQIAFTSISHECCPENGDILIFGVHSAQGWHPRVPGITLFTSRKRGNHLHHRTGKDRMPSHIPTNAPMLRETPFRIMVNIYREKKTSVAAPAKLNTNTFCSFSFTVVTSLTWNMVSDILQVPIFL